MNFLKSLTGRKGSKSTSISRKKLMEEADKLHNAKKYEELITYVSQYASDSNLVDCVGYFRGVAYRLLNKFDKSITELTKAIEIDPKRNTYAYHNRALCYYGLGKYEKALEDNKNQIKITPKNSDTFSNRGDCYCEMKRYEEALDDFKKAIQLNPDDYIAYNSRGYCYREMKRYEEALDDYKKAIKLNPNDDFAYNNRGGCYCEIKRYAEALNDYKKAIQLNPNDYIAYNNRGGCYSKTKRYEEALDDFKKAIHLNPNECFIYRNRGDCYIEMKRYEEALKDYNKAIQLNPNDHKVFFNRGCCYEKMNRDDKVLNDLNTAIELMKNVNDTKLKSKFLYHRGLLHKKLGNYERALKDITEGYKLDPETCDIFVSTMIAELNDFISKPKLMIKREPNMFQSIELKSVSVQTVSNIEEGYDIDFNEVDFNSKIPLGSGSYGNVYSCIWNGSGCGVEIAVKEINMTVVRKEDIWKEFKLIIKLHHPRVLKIYGYSYVDKIRLYIFMEKMDSDVMYYVRDKSSITIYQRYVIMKKMVQAVRHIHLKKIIHRDLKVNNFLISNYGKDVKVADFGLSTVMENSEKSHIKDKGYIGTKRYLAPELFKYQAKYRKSSDIYSLGMCFYEVLYEENPFKGIPEFQIQNAIENNKDLIPDLTLKKVPSELMDIMKMCWNREPSERPSSQWLLKWFEDNDEEFRKKYDKVKSL